MAEIAEQLTALRHSASGKEFRKPLAEALTEINEKGKDILLLEGHDDTYYVSQKTLQQLYPPDIVPKKFSRKLVTGGGIYAVLGNFDIDWSEEEWPT